MKLFFKKRLELPVARASAVAFRSASPSFVADFTATGTPDDRVLASDMAAIKIFNELVCLDAYGIVGGLTWQPEPNAPPAKPLKASMQK